MAGKIDIRGARAHNLQGIDLSVPRGQLTAVIGVSGSGKTSLVFDVLGRESRRRFLHVVDGSSTAAPWPQVDLIRGIAPAIAVEQTTKLRADALFGETTEVLHLARTLWAQLGVRHCELCGQELPATTIEEAATALLSGAPDARANIEAPLLQGKPDAVRKTIDEVRRQGFLRVRFDGELCRLDETLPEATRGDLSVVVDRLRLKTDNEARLREALASAFAAGDERAVVDTPERRFTFMRVARCDDHGLVYPPLSAAQLHWRRAGSCPMCLGSGRDEDRTCEGCSGQRLAPAAGHVRWAGASFADVHHRSLEELLAMVSQRDVPGHLAPVRDELIARGSALVAARLGHIEAARDHTAMSTGEVHRMRVQHALHGDLSGVLYLLDEPDAGIDDRDRSALALRLRALVNAGNTVVVVAHHLDWLRTFDHIIEFGPGAGPAGGRVVYEGPWAKLQGADTPSSAVLGPPRLLQAPQPQGDEEQVSAGTLHVTVAAGAMTAIEGPSGSGKSRLLDASAEALAEVFDTVTRLDRAPIGASSQSCVATAANVWTPIRHLYALTREARIRGYGAGMFSFNRPGGRCESCKGLGVIEVDGAISRHSAVCEACGGGRFSADVRSILFRGLGVHDLLSLTVGEARELFSAQPRIGPLLAAMVRVGLGHLPLGQPSDTLSGGESQRIRLAQTIARNPAGAVLLFDAPTAGLHPADQHVLAQALEELLEGGAALVVADPGGIVGSLAHFRVDLG